MYLLTQKVRQLYIEHIVCDSSEIGSAQRDRSQLERQIADHFPAQIRRHGRLWHVRSQINIGRTSIGGSRFWDGSLDPDFAQIVYVVDGSGNVEMLDTGIGRHAQ